MFNMCSVCIYTFELCITFMFSPNRDGRCKNIAPSIWLVDFVARQPERKHYECSKEHMHSFQFTESRFEIVHRVCTSDPRSSIWKRRAKQHCTHHHQLQGSPKLLYIGKTNIPPTAKTRRCRNYVQ